MAGFEAPGEIADREAGAEDARQVPEMQICGVEGPLLERFSVSLQIAVAECRQGHSGLSWARLTCGRPAVKLDQLNDIDAGRQLEEPLLEAQQRVIDLGGPGPGFRLGDLADGECVSPAAVTELAVPGIAVRWTEGMVGAPARATPPQCHPTSAEESQKRLRRICNSP